MLVSELYRKYRQRIEKLADEQLPAECSLSALHELLQQYENEAATINPATADFIRKEIANQLEHEALCSPGRSRQVVLLAAVKDFDAMAFLAKGSNPRTLS